MFILRYFKNYSPSGNRTRVNRMGICHSTTKLTEKSILEQVYNNLQ